MGRIRSIINRSERPPRAPPSPIQAGIGLCTKRTGATGNRLPGCVRLVASRIMSSCSPPAARVCSMQMVQKKHKKQAGRPIYAAAPGANPPPRSEAHRGSGKSARGSIESGSFGNKTPLLVANLVANSTVPNVRMCRHSIEIGGWGLASRSLGWNLHQPFFGDCQTSGGLAMRNNAMCAGGIHERAP